MVIAVLHGLGGVGKTTLAVHWGHRVAGQFPDGQLFVNLRGYGPSEPMDVAAALDALLRGLGVPGEKIPADIDARGALLRSTVADRRVLLVLDDARDADQVRPLLPGSGCMVLVTSRSQLRGLAAREGARRIALDALPEREAVALVRARLHSTPAKHKAIELASLCGRLPLALTIASERANQQPGVGLSELMVELRDERDRLDALADPDDPLGDVRAVFSWSYRALDQDAARLFRLLGLAPGPDLGLEAVAALAGLPIATTRRLLDRLVAVSLVGSADGRYRLHDLVRSYAAEKARDHLGSDDLLQARKRLYHWCLRTVTEAEQILLPRLTVLHPEVDVPGLPESDFAADRARATAWIEREADVLIAVAHAALEVHPWASVGIAHALWDPIRWNRSWEEAIALLEVATQASQVIGSGTAEVRALMSIGNVRLASGELDAALAVMEEALAISERFDDPGWQSRVLSNLGLIMEDLGQPQRALECHTKALEIEELLGGEWRKALVRKAIAASLTALSLFEPAVAQAEQSVALFERFGTAKDQAAAVDTLGQVHHARADYEAAIDCFSRAVRLSEKEVPRHRVIVLSNLGRSQVAAGRTAEARMTLQSAIVIMDENALTDSRDVRRAELVDLLAASVSNPIAQ